MSERSKIRKGDVVYLGSGLHLQTFLIGEITKVSNIECREACKINWITDSAKTLIYPLSYFENGKIETNIKTKKRITEKCKEMLMIGAL